VPEIVIIAGPNGAGKTTFASDYVLNDRKHLQFVNADEIARRSAKHPSRPPRDDLRAARIMLQQIDYLADAGADFAFETTLASLTYARRIILWRRRGGYTVSLIYLSLPSADASLARVRRRVEAGGHDIPQDIVRRRFDKSMRYFEEVYKSIVDEWYVWDSLEGDFVLKEAWKRS
jgi:predicted ABC-type ATPase